MKERRWCDIAKGTKRALLGGGGKFNGQLCQQRYDPRLRAGGGAWTLKALADPWKRLEARSGVGDLETALGRGSELGRSFLKPDRTASAMSSPTG